MTNKAFQLTIDSNADRLTSYLFGVTSETPVVSAFGIDADRARQFVRRWMQEHGLRIVRRSPAAQRPDSKASQRSPEQPLSGQLAELHASLLELQRLFRAG